MEADIVHLFLDRLLLHGVDPKPGGYVLQRKDIAGEKRVLGGGGDPPVKGAIHRKKGAKVAAVDGRLGAVEGPADASELLV